MVLRKKKIIWEILAVQGILGNEWSGKGIFLSTFSLGKESKSGNIP